MNGNNEKNIVGLHILLVTENGTVYQSQAYMNTQEDEDGEVVGLYNPFITQAMFGSLVSQYAQEAFKPSELRD